MPVSFEAMGYSSICSDQEYAGYLATENLFELFKCPVKQEYTGYTATENLVFYVSQGRQQLRTQLYYSCVISSNVVFTHLFQAGVHRVHSN